MKLGFMQQEVADTVEAIVRTYQKWNQEKLLWAAVLYSLIELVRYF